MVKGKNEREASAVVKKLLEVIDNDPDATVGIIAFTLEQRRMIELKVEEEAKTNSTLDLFIRTNEFSGEGEDTSLFVKNVSDVQGDERDTIIFSIGFAQGSNGALPRGVAAALVQPPWVDRACVETSEGGPIPHRRRAHPVNPLSEPRDGVPGGAGGRLDLPREA